MHSKEFSQPPCSGNRASQPYIRRKGVYLVEFWMLVLVAKTAELRKISNAVICLIFHEFIDIDVNS